MIVLSQACYYTALSIACLALLLALVRKTKGLRSGGVVIASGVAVIGIGIFALIRGHIALGNLAQVTLALMLLAIAVAVAVTQSKTPTYFNKRAAQIRKEVAAKRLEKRLR